MPCSYMAAEDGQCHMQHQVLRAPPGMGRLSRAPRVRRPCAAVQALELPTEHQAGELEGGFGVAGEVEVRC